MTRDTAKDLVINGPKECNDVERDRVTQIDQML